MSDYKPSTEELRQVWGMFSEYGGLVDRPEETLIDERYAEFDRWLETVKAKALTDLADQMRDRFTASWIRGKARELTHGPQKITGAFAVTESEADCGDDDL
ncbi:hypothetical protein [Glutamicibacter ardleyensis]|uniref:hypothetical protein n=1 Tax=Glutamicibacter ardleyensis TaxID=225894 RepID=UPI003FD43081